VQQVPLLPSKKDHYFTTVVHEKLQDTKETLSQRK